MNDNQSLIGEAKQKTQQINELLNTLGKRYEVNLRCTKIKSPSPALFEGKLRNYPLINTEGHWVYPPESIKKIKNDTELSNGNPWYCRLKILFGVLTYIALESVNTASDTLNDDHTYLQYLQVLLCSLPGIIGLAFLHSDFINQKTLHATLDSYPNLEINSSKAEQKIAPPLTTNSPQTLFARLTEAQQPLLDSSHNETVTIDIAPSSF